MIKKLLISLLLLSSASLSAQNTTPLYHLPVQIQDFMCGLATYGTTIPDDGQKAIKEKVEAVLERAEIVYHPLRHTLRKTFPFLHIKNYYGVPNISYDIPGEPVVAGYYDSASNRIDFNPVYVNKFTWEFIENVVVHETAHLVDYREHKKAYDKNPLLDPHGETWKSTVYQLGGNNNATYHHYTFCIEEDPHSIYFESQFFLRVSGGNLPEDSGGTRSTD